MTILFFITSKVAGNTIGVVEFVADTGELTGIAFRGSCKIQMYLQYIYYVSSSTNIGCARDKISQQKHKCSALAFIGSEWTLDALCQIFRQITVFENNQKSLIGIFVQKIIKITLVIIFEKAKMQIGTKL